MDIATAHVLWTVGHLRREDLPSIATDALSIGLDSPSLRVLAGLAPVDMGDAWDLFESALRELGRRPLGKQSAERQAARIYAESIILGTRSPIDGARELAYLQLDAEGPMANELAVFAGLVSEWDDHPEFRPGLEEEIRRHAESLTKLC